MNSKKESFSQNHRRPARTWIWLLVTAAALAVGVGVGSRGLVGSGPSEDGSDATDTSTAGGEQWYTCGMHPNVIQRGPGDCPICQMKLTPLKTDEDGGGGGGASKERKVLYWRAPMDPNYISQKPGKSPMGMDLVPVYADEEDSASAHTIRIDPVTVQNMGIRTAILSKGPLIKTIRTLGRVDYNEQTVTFVNTRFEGWIENLKVDETGIHVDKSDPLFDVYSPVLYSAQEEYLIALNGLDSLADAIPEAQHDARGNLQAAHTQLRDRFGLTEMQIESLKRSRKVSRTLTMPSPATGIVTEKMALEGMYVSPGMRLYTIADLSRVWVYVDVYEYQLPWVRTGQSATMTLPYTPGKRFEGKVVYIYPYLDPQTRVIKVRLEFENPTMELKPGMFANVRLESELQRDALLIPREAYIDSGTRKVAFVDLGQGKFSPRDIQVGVEAEDGMVEVLYGLDEGEVVVTSGQFMLDGESKLKEAVAKMMEAERAKTTKRRPASDEQTAHNHENLAMTMPPGTAYACPMEKHPDETDPANQGPYFSEQPGNCLHCGMKLKPIDTLSWVKKYNPGGQGKTSTVASANRGIPTGAKFACPMEQHPDQADPANQGPYFSDAAGKCPRCGMKVQPLDDLEWVRVRRAAGGGEVAYTCIDHQHVFSKTSGKCPRCGKALVPFKVMYTCPDPEHASTIRTSPGNCPHCGRGMAAYRGVWLDQTMAASNVPEFRGLADEASYRCPIHPLVHSDQPGDCTICGTPLDPVEGAPRLEDVVRKPSGSSESGYTCPMHLMESRSAGPGSCAKCGMRLVRESAIKRPTAAPEHVAAQMNYIMEHYLELQRLLASDQTKDLTLHALGLVSAAETLSKHIADPGMNLPPEAAEAANRLAAAALQITGKLDADRVTFVELSAAVRTLVEHARPDQKRWPKLYLYHCPMSKGDWLQPAEDKANPYYGFKMLNCGELKGIK